MGHFTVSEVAARTGFSSSALRYYDELGLVRPVARSAAGYRLYDDRSVELLRFVSRAKRLGLTLDDIADLVELWDRDECAPVQSRLARLVAAQLADTQRVIGELSGFASQLSDLSDRLNEQADAGACDDGCACNADTAIDGSTALVFSRASNGRGRREQGATFMTEPTQSSAIIPIVCDVSSAPDTVDQRLGAYRQLFSDAFVGRDRTVAGNRFRFRANDGIEARVRYLADLEKRCCAFFTFTITVVGGEVLWDSTVIDDDVARAVLDEWLNLPDTVAHGVEVVFDRMTASGLRFTADPLTARPITNSEVRDG